MSSKPYSELNAADLLHAPIWQWGTEGEDGDELHVRPISLSVIPREGLFHAAIDIQAANESTHAGVVAFYDGEPEPEAVALVSELGGAWSLDSQPHGRGETAWFQERFGAPFVELTPATWQARVLVEGETEFRTGVQGQGHLPAQHSRRVRRHADQSNLAAGNGRGSGG